MGQVLGWQPWDQVLEWLKRQHLLGQLWLEDDQLLRWWPWDPVFGLLLQSTICIAIILLWLGL